MKKEKYQKILIGITLIAILLGLKAPQIKADTINYNYKQYRIQYYQLGTGTTAWNSWTNFGTSSPLSSGYGIQTLAVRLGYSTKFTNGTTYRIQVEAGFSPVETITETFLNVNNTSCYGSLTSSWSNNAEAVEAIYIGAVRGTANHVLYVFDITPTTNIYGIQCNIGFTGTSEVRSVNVYTKSTITTGPDIEGAITEQTIIIEEGLNNLEITIQDSISDILEEEHTYTTEDITPEVEALEYQQTEIEDNINLNVGNKFMLYWNGDALQYIWARTQQILNNQYIEMIFMSVFALGIMKLILGR